MTAPTPRLIASVMLLTAWLGAATLTAAVLTPRAFAVLPSRELAGAVIGSVLPALFATGMVFATIAAVLSAVRRIAPGAAATALLAAAACAVAQFVVAPQLVVLRAQIGGPVERLSAADPRRVAFGLLHGYSVVGLGVAMMAAAISLTLLLLAMRSRS